MEDRERKDKRNKQIGWVTSLSVQLVLLVLFYFIIAWREPFPPIPEYGIELGFITPTTTVATNSSSPQTETVPNEPVSEEMNQTEEAQEPDVISQQESPVKVEETVSQETKPSRKEPEINSKAMMKPTENNPEKTSENTSNEKKKEKELDDRAIYGSHTANTGESEEANLALSGWVWDFKPKPDDQSDQSGKIVYKIVVDKDGYLVKIETIISTVSPAVERKYRQTVEKLTFSKTTDYKTASVSTGMITFIIKSR